MTLKISAAMPLSNAVRLCLTGNDLENVCGYAAPHMDFISPNSPAYYLTSVTKGRLPIFRLDKLKTIACTALNEARKSGGFLILAYVIMPDHFHVITDGEKKPSVIQRFINGITSRRVIDYLKEGGHTSSLEKLRHEEYSRRHRYSLWDHHPNTRLLTSEDMLMQRIRYTHQNPVRLGLVERAEDYRFSSARIWNRNPLEDEPLMVDIDKIRWRKETQRHSRGKKVK
jgi:putative transposase